MMRTLLLKLVPLSAVLAALLFIPAPMAAQSFGLAPAEVRVNFKPGQLVQFDLSVSNGSDTAVAMRTTVTDLWYNEKTNEKVFGPPGSLPHSASNWIEFVPRNFTVPAHGTGKVNVVITPPPGAAGGYYAVLFVESKPELARAATSEQKAVFTNMRLGALILLSADGTENYSIEVTDPKFTPPSGNQNLELEFQLANNSNSHIFPQVTLAILNADKRLVARAETEPKRFFPGQKDSVKISWPGSLPGGDYTGVLTVVYGKDKVYTQDFPFTLSSERHLAAK